MKKISEELMDMGLKASLKKELKNSYQEAKKDECFNELVKLLNMSDEELMKYTSTLQECATEYKNCQSCRNMAGCPNHVAGYCYLPSVQNGHLVFNYKACRFQEKLLEATKYLNNVSYFDVPSAIKEARMKDVYHNDKNRFEVITYITDFINNYGKKPLKGLYLNGSFGSGKSYLIAAMFNELAKKNVKSAVVFWPEFLRDLKASFQSDYSEKFEMIKRVPLLLIDDIGAENTTAWSRDEILCPLLQYRMDENLPTFFTSNLTIEDLEHHFSITKDGSEEIKARRIIERIKQLTVDMKLISKNLRK